MCVCVCVCVESYINKYTQNTILQNDFFQTKNTRSLLLGATHKEIKVEFLRIVYYLIRLVFNAVTEIELHRYM